MDLRARVIRLAYANPDLRSELLPLLIESDLRTICAGNHREAGAGVSQLVNTLSKKSPKFRDSPFVKNLRAILAFLANAGREVWKAVVRILSAVARFIFDGEDCSDLLSERNRLLNFMKGSREDVKKRHPQLYRLILYQEFQSDAAPKLMALYEAIRRRGAKAHDVPGDALNYLEKVVSLALVTDQINYYKC